MNNPIEYIVNFVSLGKNEFLTCSITVTTYNNPLVTFGIIYQNGDRVHKVVGNFGTQKCHLKKPGYAF